MRRLRELTERVANLPDLVGVSDQAVKAAIVDMDYFIEHHPDVLDDDALDPDMMDEMASRAVESAMEGIDTRSIEEYVLKQMKTHWDYRRGEHEDPDEPEVMAGEK